eukprot:SAG31_NODE_6029_length_2202_cov_1.383738_1_plen_448_part_00
MSSSDTGLIIEVYNVYVATADETFLTNMYPAVARCARWLVRRASAFGVPQGMQSTYDSWKLDTHDITTYSAHLHISAMKMAATLASARNDSTLAMACKGAASRAETTLASKLWHPEMKSYRAWWDDNTSTTSANATMTGSLYGAVWQVVQGMPIGASRGAQMLGHLAAERRLNLGEYGLVAGYRLVAEFSTGPSPTPDDPSYTPVHPTHGHTRPGFLPDGRCKGDAPDGGPLGQDGSTADTIWNVPCPDCGQWAANQFTHSAVSLGLGETAEIALEPSLRLLRNVRDRLRDFWDWVDYTAGPGQNCSYWAERAHGSPGMAGATPGGPQDYGGYPMVNNHYTRQQIAHAIPLALSGQRWDARVGSLSFKFATGAPARLPFHTPFAMGTVERVYSARDMEVVALRLTLYAGELVASELLYGELLLATELRLGTGVHTLGSLPVREIGDS